MFLFCKKFVFITTLLRIVAQRAQRKDINYSKEHLTTNAPRELLTKEDEENTEKNFNYYEELFTTKARKHQKSFLQKEDDVEIEKRFELLLRTCNRIECTPNPSSKTADIRRDAGSATRTQKQNLNYCERLQHQGNKKT